MVQDIHDVKVATEANNKSMRHDHTYWMCLLYNLHTTWTCQYGKAKQIEQDADMRGTNSICIHFFISNGTRWTKFSLGLVLDPPALDL